VFFGRRGPVTIAVAAAVIAGILLYVFVQQYKKHVNGTVSTTPVFIATRFIQRGTSTSVVAANTLFQRTLVKSGQVRVGAITDPAVLQGEVAATNIYPGQQLTLGDFTRSDVTIASQLSGTQRAIAIPIDNIRGLVPYVQSGDYVDVLESTGGGGGGQGGAVTTLAQDVLVLSTGGGTGGGGIGGGGGGGGELVLRVTDKTALDFAKVANSGGFYITLRPVYGGTNSVHALTTIGK
jgi:Flp pilus assembly protein CpaB